MAPLFPGSPTFDLPLGGYGSLGALEILLEQEGYRRMAGGIAVERAGLSETFSKPPRVVPTYYEPSAPRRVQKALISSVFHV